MIIKLPLGSTYPNTVFWSLNQPLECELKLGEHISIIKQSNQKSSAFLEKYQNQRLKWQ